MCPAPRPIKRWIYAHECAHQFRGPDEKTADCFAVQRGRRQGWLSPGGVDEICNFIKSAKGDWIHISGPNRCRAMKKGSEWQENRKSDSGRESSDPSKTVGAANHSSIEVSARWRDGGRAFGGAAYKGLEYLG